MSAKLLDEKIKKFNHCLCVGMDIDPDMIPDGWTMRDYYTAVENCLDDVPALKFNFAFTERFFDANHIPTTTIKNRIRDKIVIADAKRCDVGHSAEHYAARIFDELGFDAVTVSPYMGLDSLTPFLSRENKLTFALALTSNPGANDFQFHPYSSLEDALVGCQTAGLNEPLFVKVIRKIYAHAQNLPGDVGFVVGATRPEAIGLVRSLAPDAYILVPGVGTQGGSVEEVLKQTNKRILVNVGRDIVYAYKNTDSGVLDDNPELWAVKRQVNRYIERIRPYMAAQ